MTALGSRTRHALRGAALWEHLAAACILALLTGALIGPIFSPLQQETPILRLIWLPVYVMTLGLLAFRAREMARAWPAWLAVALMVALAFASRYWSLDPPATTRRAIALALNGAFAIYLGVAFRGASLPRLLTWTCLALGVGSLIAVFAFPRFGLHQDVNAGMWRGLWYEKNQMGMVMAVGMVCSAAWLATAMGVGSDKNGRVAARAALAALAVCGLALLGSQSKTALLMAMLGIGVVAVCALVARIGPLFGVILIWGLGLTALVGLLIWSQYSAEILALFGKDPTLTGRTDIWDSIGRLTSQRPWLGYGYGAFWGLDSQPALWIRHETGWRVPSAHHGWLDLQAELGWLGVGLVGAVIAVVAVAVLIRLPRLGAREGYWSLAYLAAFILLSLSESVLMAHQGLPWTLFVAVLARSLTSDPPR